MKIGYFPETDTLFIELADRPGADTQQIGKGIILYTDDKGRPVGLDIEHASKHLSLTSLHLRKLPFDIRQVA